MRNLELFRRAAAWRGRFPALFLLGSLLASAPGAEAAELQFLDHSELALARLYDDISSATDTIDLTYFIWDPCSASTKVLMKKLREKARPKPTAKNPRPRPVKVRLLLDAFTQPTELLSHEKHLAELSAYFRENGIEAKFFNTPFLADRRTHSKLTLVDKNIPGQGRMVTGGRNISDEYFGMAQKNFVDRDVALDGPSSQGAIDEAKRGFEKLWKHPLSTSVASAVGGSGKVGQCAKWDARARALEKYLQANAKKAVAAEKPVSCDQVRFTMDDMRHSGDRVDGKPSSVAVLELINEARRSLTIENQYFSPDDLYLKPMLRRIKRERPRVKIDLHSNRFDEGKEPVVLWHTHYMQVENGGSQTNHSHFRVAGLLDRWKFTPTKNSSYSYHAKTFVADGKNAIVGSFNMDTRSMLTNGESGVFVKSCPAFAKKVEKVAKYTSKIWALEEQYVKSCYGVAEPQAQVDPLYRLVQFFTKGLQ